jgi:uncharacterized membrane protein
MLRDLLLTFHIAAGTTGLVLGPIAMRAPKRRGRHTKIGEAYHWVMLAVCVSASVLAITAWDRIWWLLPIAVFSYGNAVLGYAAAKRRWPGWLRAHIGGMGGSYIALVTALLVVNVGQDLPLGLFVAAFFVPTIFGTPIITRVTSQVMSGRRLPGVTRA